MQGSWLVSDLQEVPMRNDRKLAGLLLILLIVAVAFVTYRRDRTDVSTSMPANSSVSSPIATLAGSRADTGGPTQTAPPAEPAGGGAAQDTNGEASKRIGTDGAKAMRGGAQPKVAGASKAKGKNAEQLESAHALARGQGESSDRIDAGTNAEPTPEPVQPPKEMGTLIGRIHNSVGSTLRLIKISYFVDESQVVTQNYPSGLEREADVQVFERRLDLGNHTLRALVEYQGDGGGVFSYFEGYRYKVSSSHEFTATANTTTQITVVSYEKGGPLTSFENRLGVAFRIGTPTSK
jgi:hypothetical protein